MQSRKLRRLAGRVPRRWRRAVPTGLRNAVVNRLGHPDEAFDPARHPRRINLGAGFDKRDGYLNVDLQALHDPDLVGDVRSLPELPDAGYDEVVAQDVLEHLQRGDVPVALREWRRLLAPGGRLWLRVPDLISLLGWLAENEDPERQREIIHFLFGTQAYTGDFHLSGFTDVLLCDELRAAGFGRIELERRDDWLWEGEAFAAEPDAPDTPALVWGAGFYRRELGPEGSNWRWAGREAELLLYTSEPAEVDLGLVLLAGRVDVTGAGLTARLEPGAHTLRVMLSKGANRVRFETDDVHAFPDDPRELAFQLGGSVRVAAAERIG